MLKVSRYRGLAQLPDSYHELFRQAGTKSFFFTEPWFRNFEATIVEARQRVSIYGVENTESNLAVAVLPMWQPDNSRSPWSPVIFEGLSNYYTCLFGPVVLDGGAGYPEVARALATALWQDRHEWDVVNLKPLDVDSPLFDLLACSLRDAGMVVQTYFCFGNWYFDLAGRCYAQYLESLSSVLRKNVPYNIRRLKRAGGQVELITGGDALQWALDDYERVYQASWKIPEKYPQFVRGLVRSAASHGSLRLGLAYVDGQPVAAQIWIVHEGVASIYKVAYDERSAKLSVGTVLTAKLMEHVIDVDKVRLVDYLSGDDDYKRNWMSHRRERWGILAINPRSLRGLSQVVRHVGGRALKRLWALASSGLMISCVISLSLP